MARRLPKSKASLAQIDGIGEAKTHKYGQMFLDRIAAAPGNTGSTSEPVPF
jgi:superfamily II DNA helicase RecQ